LTEPAADNSVLNVLQITDLHLRQVAGGCLLGVDTQASFEAVLEQALAERIPDAVLVTGDVAHDSQPEVYQRFWKLLRNRFRGPALVLAGNHDITRQMGSLLAAGELRLGAWVLLALDSHVDDQPAASVDTLEFARLKEACESAGDCHVLVATHHPPIEIGCPWLDKDRIKNGGELLEWLAEHSTARAVVFGHAHQKIESRYRDIALLGTPSTCIQFAPGTERFAVDDRQPGYRWLHLDSRGGVTSSVERVEDFPMTIDMTQFK
jgi:Icc protein